MEDFSNPVSATNHIQQAAVSLIQETDQRFQTILNCLHSGHYHQARQIWRRDVKQTMIDVGHLLDKAHFLKQREQPYTTEAVVPSTQAVFTPSGSFELPSDRNSLLHLQSEINQRLSRTAAAA